MCESGHYQPPTEAARFLITSVGLHFSGQQHGTEVKIVHDMKLALVAQNIFQLSIFFDLAGSDDISKSKLSEQVLAQR